MKRKVGCGVLGIFALLVLGVMLARQPAAVPVPTLIPEKAATVVLPPATKTPVATSAAYAPPTPSAMSNADLHSGPGTNYPVVGSVAAGEALVVIGQTEDGLWYLLENGQWISIDWMLNAPYADVVTDYAAPPEPAIETPTTKTSAITTAFVVRATLTPIAMRLAATEGPGYQCDKCIKGNISTTKEERIYHMPGCGSYVDTEIDEAKGERMFSSEAEAIAAGWRKAQNCP